LTSVSACAEALGGDEWITADRVESKYLLAPDALAPLSEELSRSLAPHRYTGHGSSSLPGAHHLVTTIYFDTPGRTSYQAAVRDESHSIKLRAREYHDLDPAPGAIAMDAAEVYHRERWLWFELKERAGARSTKRRFRASQLLLSRFFQGRILDAAALSIAEASTLRERESFEDVVRYCSTAGPLQADCIVSYRRRAWQDSSAGLRVTLDVGLAFYRPSADLWTRERVFLGQSPGAACGGMSGVVLEVKRRTAMPEWLGRALEAMGAAPQAFSKFVAASEAVHGSG
jgi:hypothetical protein